MKKKGFMFALIQFTVDRSMKFLLAHRFLHKKLHFSFIVFGALSCLQTHGRFSGRVTFWVVNSRSYVSDRKVNTKKYHHMISLQLD